MSQAAKPAKQARSKASRDKLVAALDRLLRERDFENISIADLAAEAGLSVGAVYRRFENKDAFIPVIFELYQVRHDAFMASGEARLDLPEGAGLREALHMAISTAMSFLRREGHLIRAAHLYGRLRPDLVGEEWDELLDLAVEGMRQLVAAFSDEIARSDPEAAARMLTYLMNTLPIEKGVYAEEGVGSVLNFDDDAFVDAMVLTIYGYLTTPEA
ncbi:TetR/AcrR family transcriptional regulator [Maricaulis sp. CAU 1757]